MNVVCDGAARFFKYYDPVRVAEYIHEHCREEADEVIRQADLLLDHTFVFTDRWDMEPCSVPYQISLEDWTTSPNGDPEWVFMLNRHDFLHKLWQAYLLTGSRAYADKILFFLLDWIRKNPITQQGTDATRTIDTGIRCMNWSILLMHLLGSHMISDEDALLVLDSLAEQCRNMQDRYIGKYALSNWGVLQTTAICTAHLWLPDYIPDTVADWAWEELQKQLSLQILSDGSHWEQSPMYHVEVLNTSAKLLAQLQMAQKIGVTLTERAGYAIRANTWSHVQEADAGPGWLAEAVRVLSRHVLYTSDPGFRQLPIGDSDVTDVRDVLARAAVLLSGSGIYRWAAGEWMDLDSVYLMGTAGVKAFHEIHPLIPHRKVWNCEDSGNLCFRSDWTENASFTAVKCGTLGSSHGHADQTHMSLYYKGKAFLIDSGRYTYLEEDPLRPLLKKACAHNVCVIDGQSGGEPNGSWSYHSYDETLKNYSSHIEDAHYVEMCFHGKLKDGAPYLVKRKVLGLDGGIWLSVQDVICQGAHQVKEYFHFDPGTVVDSGEEYFTVFNGDAALKITHSGDILLKNGVISTRYNEKQSAPVLMKLRHMKDRFTDQTLICDANYKVNPVPVYQMRKETPVSSDIAAAWDVEKPDGSKKTLIVWNRETCRGDKLYTCHGCSVYGKAIVLSWEGNHCRVIRLKT